MAATPATGDMVISALRETARRKTAFHEAAARFRRQQALAQLAEMGRAGDFDGLLDKRAYRA